MNAINKYWQQELNPPYQQNLFGLIEVEKEHLEPTLLASYWRVQSGWEWRIYVYNNTPDMREHGTCPTEEETRHMIDYFIHLT